MNYTDTVKQISWIVSLYAIGDGLGYFFARKVYGFLSVKQTVNLATIASVIASTLFALAGDVVSSKIVQ